MIVKIKNNKVGTWSYFECCIIHSGINTLDEVKDRGDAVRLFDSQPIQSEFATKQVKSLRLEDKESHFRLILTDRVCYVLNNEGKTIDKI